MKVQILVASLALTSSVEGGLQVSTEATVEMIRQGRVAETISMLKAQGDSASPTLAMLIKTDDLGYAVKQRLFGLLSTNEGPSSDKAIVDLLQSNSPHFRGLAAKTAGMRRLRAATPKLIDLLRDNATYLTQVTTDPATETPISVGDAALEALEQIAGKRITRSRDKGKQVEQWDRWWSKQKNSPANPPLAADR